MVYKKGKEEFEIVCSDDMCSEKSVHCNCWRMTSAMFVLDDVINLYFALSDFTVFVIYIEYYFNIINKG